MLVSMHADVYVHINSTYAVVNPGQCQSGSLRGSIIGSCSHSHLHECPFCVYISVRS